MDANQSQERTMTVPATAPEPRQGRIKVAPRRKPWAISLSVLLVFCGLNLHAQDPWPDLPQNNAAVEIPAQEWPRRAEPRSVRVLIHYPGGTLAGVKPDTGLMLTLHNWGGTDCVGTAAPQVLADRLNVVAICVNYLQSGKADAIEAAEPYDYGYLQALDALRALWIVRHGLQTRGIVFDDGRIYSTGGSGGGNVTLMANKLAPRTFTAIVDMCGMKKLSDDIAFRSTPVTATIPLRRTTCRPTSRPFALSEIPLTWKRCVSSGPRRRSSASTACRTRRARLPTPKNWLPIYRPPGWTCRPGS
jgi:hypothetical protein